PMGSAEAITEPFEGRLPRLPALEDAGGAEADNRQPPIGANLLPPFLQQPRREPAVVAADDEIGDVQAFLRGDPVRRGRGKIVEDPTAVGLVVAQEHPDELFAVEKAEADVAVLPVRLGKN